MCLGTLRAGDVTSIQYGRPQQLCTLKSKKITESSGLAVSRRNPNLLWTHNDSGDDAHIYCIDRQGKRVGTCKLKKTKAVDWEDMCSYVIDGRPKLLVADTGDNLAIRKSCQLHIIDEPQNPQDDVSRVQSIRLRYSTGPTDCEAVAVDPTLREILFVEKRFALTCRVFQASLPADGDERELLAKPIARINLPLVTAMDIAHDGSRAIVLTLGPAFEFTRSQGQTWQSAFRARPRTIPMPARRQGEAICYAADGYDLLLTSEKTPTPLFLVPTISTVSQ